MERDEIEALLRSHLRGVHEELNGLLRGVEKALDGHLARTESALADVLEAEAQRTEARFAAIEKRLAALEGGA